MQILARKVKTLERNHTESAFNLRELRRDLEAMLGSSKQRAEQMQQGLTEARTAIMTQLEEKNAEMQRALAEQRAALTELARELATVSARAGGHWLAICVLALAQVVTVSLRLAATRVKIATAAEKVTSVTETKSQIRPKNRRKDGKKGTKKGGEKVATALVGPDDKGGTAPKWEGLRTAVDLVIWVGVASVAACVANAARSAAA